MSSLSPILDVIIGLIGVYIAFSLIASYCQEQIAAIFQLRAKGLVTGLAQLLNGNTDAFQQFTKDPMFQALRSAAANVVPLGPTDAEKAAANAKFAADQAAASKAAADEAAAVHAPPPDPNAAAAAAAQAAADRAAAANQAANAAGAAKTTADQAVAAQAPATPGDKQQAAATTNAALKDVRGPSYLSAQQFSTIFMNVLAKKGQLDLATADAADVLKTAQAAADALGVGDQVRALITKSQGDVQTFVGSLESWYDDHMDRLSGWYKRQTQKILFAIGLVLAIAFNVDSIRLYAGLNCNVALRGSVSIAAAKAQPAPAATQAPATAGQSDASFVKEMLDSVPLGWVQSPVKNWWPPQWPPQFQVPDKALICDTNSAWVPPVDWTYVPLKALGILITALALTLGAPFWFDMLSKVTRVRLAGAKPNSTKTK